MLRGVLNRAVGALLLALFIIAVGGCGSSSHTPLAPTETATVRGSVLDSVTGLPLRDVTVRIGSIIVHLDAVGEFVVQVPPGPAPFSVSADGYWAYSGTITVTTGDNDLGTVPLVELPPAPPGL